MVVGKPMWTLVTFCITSGSKFDDLGPTNRGRKGSKTLSAGGGGGKTSAGCHASGCVYRTDNVWHHEKSRRKLKHLSEQPPCHCGAGRYYCRPFFIVGF